MRVRTGHRNRQMPGEPSWFGRPSTSGSGRIRLFAIPHAGAGAAAFRSWQDAASRDIEVWPVRLPGRERRISERPIPEIEAVADGLCEAISALDGRTFALFGHCFGALVAFEVARRLDRVRPPCGLFVSSQAAPSRFSGNNLPVRPDVPTEQLIAHLREVGGTDERLLADRELFSLLEPAIRADLRAADEYIYVRHRRLAIPVHAYFARGDRFVEEGEMRAWGDETIAQRFMLHAIGNTDHAFTEGAWLLLLRSVEADLRSTLRGGPHD